VDLNQFIRRDRQIANPFSSRVENCIRDSRRRADNSDFTNAARAQIGHVRIRSVDEIDVEFRRVRVHCDVVVGKIGIDDSAGLLIGNRRFEAEQRIGINARV
jgi:hypothetical protein